MEEQGILQISTAHLQLEKKQNNKQVLLCK